MLRFFRSSGSMVVIAIFMIGIGSWLHVLVESETVATGKYGTFMFQVLTGWFIDTRGLYVWFGLIFFLLTVLLIILANARLQLVEKISYLPALCYVLLIGGVPEIHLFNPAIFATILLVIAFLFLAEAFKSEQLAYSFFTASVLISAASFFYQYMYMYMLAVWLVIALLRPSHWREWFFSILGFAFPLFLAFSWFFLVDDDYTRMGAFFDEIYTIQWLTPSVTISTVVFFTLCMMLFVVTFVYLLQYLSSRKNILRNRYAVLVVIAVITAGLAFVVPDIFPQAWYLLAFPMSFIIANYLATTRSIRWGTIVLSLLFASVMVAQAILFSTK